MVSGIWQGFSISLLYRGIVLIVFLSWGRIHKLVNGRLHSVCEQLPSRGKALSGVQVLLTCGDPPSLDRAEPSAL